MIQNNFSSGASISTARTLTTTGSGSVYANPSLNSSASVNSFEEKWKRRNTQYQNRWIAEDGEVIRQNSSHFVGVMRVGSREDYVPMSEVLEHQRRAELTYSARLEQGFQRQHSSSSSPVARQPPKLVEVVPRPQITTRSTSEPGWQSNLKNFEEDDDDLKKPPVSSRTSRTISDRDSRRAENGQLRESRSFFSNFFKFMSCSSTGNTTEAIVNNRRPETPMTPPSGPTPSMTMSSEAGFRNAGTYSELFPEVPATESVRRSRNLSDPFPGLEPDVCSRRHDDLSGLLEEFDDANDTNDVYYSQYPSLADQIVSSSPFCGGASSQGVADSAEVDLNGVRALSNSGDVSRRWSKTSSHNGSDASERIVRSNRGSTSLSHDSNGTHRKELAQSTVAPWSRAQTALSTFYDEERIHPSSADREDLCVSSSPPAIQAQMEMLQTYSNQQQNAASSPTSAHSSQSSSTVPIMEAGGYVANDFNMSTARSRSQSLVSSHSQTPTIYSQTQGHYQQRPNSNSRTVVSSTGSQHGIPSGSSRPRVHHEAMPVDTFPAYQPRTDYQSHQSSTFAHRAAEAFYGSQDHHAYGGYNAHSPHGFNRRFGDYPPQDRNPRSSFPPRSYSTDAAPTWIPSVVPPHSPTSPHQLVRASLLRIPGVTSNAEGSEHSSEERMQFLENITRRRSQIAQQASSTSYPVVHHVPAQRFGPVPPEESLSSEDTNYDARHMNEHVQNEQPRGSYLHDPHRPGDAGSDRDDMERAIQQSIEDEQIRRRQAIRDRLQLNRAFIESMRDLQESPF